MPKTERALPQKTIKTIISDKLAEIPDTRAWYVNERGERELSFSMLSHNGEELNDAVRKLEGALRQVPGFKNVAADASIDRPELRVVPKFDVAARLGVAPSKIAETIRVATIGDIDANLAKFNAGDRLVPIRVQIAEDARTDMQRLQNLRVTNTTNVAIPLAAVADITFGRGPSSISRYDRERRAVIGVDLESRYAMSSAREMFLKVVDEQKLPASVRLQPSGDAEIQDEVATGFMTAMGTGLMIVFGVLVLLFGSVAQPITILLSLPLSFGGVVLALLATNNSVSMPVYIGLLMLMGIVTKNAIMLVDFAVEEVARGVPRFDAVIDAGRKRARPIVMTTLAMVAGMVPSAMAIGDGGEFRAPMAIAVIGGLLVSTVLSLVFVPSFFTVMDDVGRFVWWIFGRFIGPTDESPEYLAETAHTRPAAPHAPRRRVASSHTVAISRARRRGMSMSEGARASQRCVRIRQKNEQHFAARAGALQCRGCGHIVSAPLVPPYGVQRRAYASGPLAAALRKETMRSAAARRASVRLIAEGAQPRVHGPGV